MGNLSSYIITRTGPDQFDVQGSTSLDHLTGIEFAQFSDERIELTPVPEPSTMLLVGSGLVGLVGFRRKVKR